MDDLNEAIRADFDPRPYPSTASAPCEVCGRPARPYFYARPNLAVPQWREEPRHHWLCHIHRPGRED